jgi:hypothetical protein
MIPRENISPALGPPTFSSEISTSKGKVFEHYSEDEAALAVVLGGDGFGDGLPVTLHCHRDRHAVSRGQFLLDDRQRGDVLAVNGLQDVAGLDLSVRGRILGEAGGLQLLPERDIKLFEGRSYGVLL